MTLNNAALNNLVTVQTTRKEPQWLNRTTLSRTTPCRPQKSRRRCTRASRNAANSKLPSDQIERIDRLRYRAYGANGATLDFGVGEGLLTPVELLLAAIAGCSSVDVDAGTSRRSTPEVFEVLASALKQTEDGAVRLDDVEVDFDVRFPADEQGAKAQKMVDRLIQLSEQKDCTVSRTVEHPTNVSFHNLAD